MTMSAAVLQDSVVVGTSARMHAVFEFLRVIGTSESTVLVTGESGTGKEVTATLIHQTSMGAPDLSGGRTTPSSATAADRSPDRPPARSRGRWT